jgi:hypothetical protein
MIKKYLLSQRTHYWENEKNCKPILYAQQTAGGLQALWNSHPPSITHTQPSHPWSKSTHCQRLSWIGYRLPWQGGGWWWACGYLQTPSSTADSQAEVPEEWSCDSFALFLGGSLRRYRKLPRWQNWHLCTFVGWVCCLHLRHWKIYQLIKIVHCLWTNMRSF